MLHTFTSCKETYLYLKIHLSQFGVNSWKLDGWVFCHISLSNTYFYTTCECLQCPESLTFYGTQLCDIETVYRPCYQCEHFMVTPNLNNNQRREGRFGDCSEIEAFFTGRKSFSPENLSSSPEINIWVKKQMLRWWIVVKLVRTTVLSTACDRNFAFRESFDSKTFCGYGSDRWWYSLLKCFSLVLKLSWSWFWS